MDQQQRSQVTTGMLLIALGLVFLGRRLAWLPGLDLGRLWPMFLVIIGVSKFLGGRAEGKPGSGLWLIFLGALFLLHTYDAFRLNDSWPLFIVAGGVSILFGKSHVKVGGRTSSVSPAPSDVPVPGSGVNGR